MTTRYKKFIEDFSIELVETYNDTKPLTNREKKIISEATNKYLHLEAVKKQILEERTMTNYERKQKKLTNNTSETTVLNDPALFEDVIDSKSQSRSSSPKNKTNKTNKTNRTNKINSSEIEMETETEIRLTNKDKKILRESQVTKILEDLNQKKNDQLKILDEFNRNKQERESMIKNLDQKIHDEIEKKKQKVEEEVKQKLYDQIRITEEMEAQIKIKKIEQLRLIKEIEQTKSEHKFSDKKECKICFNDFDKLKTLIPCGHYGFCNDCVSGLQNKCPECRKYVQNSVITYT